MSEKDALIKPASEDRRSEVLHLCKLVVFPGIFNIIVLIPSFLPVLIGWKITAAKGIRGMNDVVASQCFSTYFIGWALASIITIPISDVIGRRLPILISIFVGLVAACMAAFSTTPFLFGLAIFVMGFTFPPGAMISYLLCGESVSDQWRPTMGACLFTGNSVMIVIMSVITRAMQHMEWRIEWLWWFFPYAVLLIVAPWCFSESPKFNKELEQALGETRLLSEDLQSEAYTAARGSYSAASESSCGTGAERGVEDPDKNAFSFKLLFQPQYCRPLVDTVICWFICVQSYYGLGYAAGNLSPDLYTNVMLEGFVDILSYFLAGPITDHCGPFPTQIGAFTLAALAFLIAAFVGSGTPLLIFSLVGRSAINVAFSTVFILMLISFPTKCRATALGVSNAIARGSGALSPFLADIPGSTTCAMLGIAALTAGLATWDLQRIVKEE